MSVSKIESYLGFCLRARKMTFGVDDLETQRKGVFLILVDAGLGESSFKQVIKSGQNLKCPIYVLEKELLGSLLHKPAVKAVGIKEKNLAAAIINSMDGESQFKLYSGGNN